MLLRGFVRMEKSSSLSNLPVKQLISLCKERHVNPSGCVEKQDIVRALKDAGGRKFNKTVEGLDCSVLDNDCEVDLLCVLIHGYGSNKEDLLGIGTQLMPNIKRKVRFVCPNGPISLGGSMSSWYDVETILEKAMQASNADILSHIVEMCPTGLDTSSEKIARLIDSLVESEKAINKDFSRSNVILGGFSQGSSLSLDCAIMHGTETPFHSLFLWSGMALRNSKLREKQKVIRCTIELWFIRRLSHVFSSFFSFSGFCESILLLCKSWHTRSRCSFSFGAYCKRFDVFVHEGKL